MGLLNSLNLSRDQRRVYAATAKPTRIHSVSPLTIYTRFTHRRFRGARHPSY